MGGGRARNAGSRARNAGGRERSAGGRSRSAGGRSSPGGVSFRVRWADLDANGHLRNTAYSEYATEARLRHLSEGGFPPERFRELGIGPVIFREEARYRREVLLGDAVTLDFRAEGLSEDGSRWRVAHRVCRSDGEVAATLRLEGGWMELEDRNLVRPPPGLLEVLRRVPRTDDYEELGSVVRGRG